MKHNFLTEVNNVRGWNNQPIITSIHPKTIIKIPVLLTIDTLSLFDHAVKGEDANLLTHAIHSDKQIDSIRVLGTIKRKAIQNGHLQHTGGNCVLVRAMFTRVICKQNILCKDIGYMWNLLDPAAKNHAIRMPYRPYIEILRTIPDTPVSSTSTSTFAYTTTSTPHSTTSIWTY